MSPSYSCSLVCKVIVTIFLSTALLALSSAVIAKSPLAAIRDLIRDSISQPQVPSESYSGLPTELDFTLKHVVFFGSYNDPNRQWTFDVEPGDLIWRVNDDGSTREPPPKLQAWSEPYTVQRLVDRKPETINSILETSYMTGMAAELPLSAWTVDKISGPNIADRKTVLCLARMAADAYVVEPGDTKWQKVGEAFNLTDDFGWDGDGLRGHIFADSANKTIVISLKGTSAALFDGSGTTTNDKENDNLFFSCCCGEGGKFLWRRVCDCQISTNTCNSTCLRSALKKKNHYYYAAQDLYHNVTELYPGADIWLTGHSLGGSTSSLLGLTYGVPAVTFEAPGDALPASRLGLPTPPGYDLGAHQQRLNTGGYHFGHTADPVYMGTCNSVTSFCTLAGYAMESVCHTGYECVYDTVSDFGWSVSISNHRINGVISDVIEKYDEPASCTRHVECVDCPDWHFFEGSDSEEKPTTKTTSPFRTETQTCKTPGWWGCLDESTFATDGPGILSIQPTQGPDQFNFDDSGQQRIGR